MKFATQEYMEDAIPLDAHRIVVLAEDGQTAFEIQAGKDGHSIEIRGVDTYKVGKTIYINRLRIMPHVSNSINVSSTEWES